MKKSSVLIESLLVFFVIISCFFIAIPFFLKNTFLENNIAIWNQKFSNIQYAYSILRIQTEEDNQDFISSDFQHKLNIFLRKKTDINQSYNPSFLNKKNVNETYVFDNYFENSNGLVIAFKWINKNCINKEICAVMSVDVNGLKGPNIWGKDIFAVNFYRDSVEPAGYGLKLNKLMNDCSNRGSGVYCSAYYLIGGLGVK